jgi:outer membrane receptor protein involved in Fe transport
MDGTGNQMNISTRGLDPHRGWEFNIRADGVMTNSDIYGYPASHFSLPMEAIGRIELVRGTGALQYGAQFGGMLNYSLKQADTTVLLASKPSIPAGLSGFSAVTTAVGGKVGKLEYYAFYSKPRVRRLPRKQRIRLRWAGRVPEIQAVQKSHFESRAAALQLPLPHPRPFDRCHV